jgi:hypothetical protein
MPDYASDALSIVDSEMPSPLPDDLLRLYALLALVKGVNVALEDVHDAWAIWRQTTDANHRSLIPFGQLTQEVQELDRPYVEAIHRAASRIYHPTLALAALDAPETPERTDLIGAYATHLRAAGDRADAAEATIARVRADCQARLLNLDVDREEWRPGIKAQARRVLNILAAHASPGSAPESGEEWAKRLADMSLAAAREKFGPTFAPETPGDPRSAQVDSQASDLQTPDSARVTETPGDAETEQEGSDDDD